jgi:hypothetical protein
MKAADAAWLRGGNGGFILIRLLCQSMVSGVLHQSGELALATVGNTSESILSTAEVV